MKKLLSIVLVLFISACATPMPTSKEDVASQVGVHFDPYTKVTGIAAKPFSVPDVGSYFDPAFAHADLRGWIAIDGTEEMFLYVHYHGANWKFYSNAADINGKPLSVTKIDAQVLGASMIEEQFQAQLGRDYVEKHIATGMNIKFLGKYGTLVVQVPAVYVEGFLQQFNAARSQITPVLNSKTRAIFGVQFISVTAALAATLKMTEPRGVAIINVATNSTAEQAGIKIGRVIAPKRMSIQ